MNKKSNCDRRRKLGQRLQPGIVIGLGGTGREVLMRLRHKVVKKFGKLENFPILKYLLVDADKTSQHYSYYVPGADESIRLKPEEILSVPLRHPESYLKNPESFPFVHDWIPFTDNQGLPEPYAWYGPQIRSGGTLWFTNLIYQKRTEVRTKITCWLNAITSAYKNFGDVSNTRCCKNSLTVVSSLSGGTGSGMFLDMGYFLKNAAPNEKLFAYIALPDIYADIAQQRTYANGYAAFKEMAYFWDYRHQFPREWNTDGDPQNKHWPYDLVYLIGTKNLQAIQLTQGRFGRAAIFDMMAERLFQYYTSAEFFCRWYHGVCCNNHKLGKLLFIEDAKEKCRDTSRCFVQNYSSFGLSKIVYPLEELQDITTYLIGQEICRTGRWYMGEEGTGEELDKLGEEILSEAVAEKDDKLKPIINKNTDDYFNQFGQTLNGEIEKEISKVTHRLMKGTDGTVDFSPIDRKLHETLVNHLDPDNDVFKVQKKKLTTALIREIKTNLLDMLKASYPTLPGSKVKGLNAILKYAEMLSKIIAEEVYIKRKALEIQRSLAKDRGYKKELIQNNFKDVRAWSWMNGLKRKLTLDYLKSNLATVTREVVDSEVESTRMNYWIGGMITANKLVSVFIKRFQELKIVLDNAAESIIDKKTKIVQEYFYNTPTRISLKQNKRGLRNEFYKKITGKTIRPGTDEAGPDPSVMIGEIYKEIFSNVTINESLDVFVRAEERLHSEIDHLIYNLVETIRSTVIKSSKEHVEVISQANIKSFSDQIKEMPPQELIELIRMAKNYSEAWVWKDQAVAAHLPTVMDGSCDSFCIMGVPPILCDTVNNALKNTPLQQPLDCSLYLLDETENDEIVFYHGAHGIPLCWLDGLKDWKRAYDDQCKRSYGHFDSHLLHTFKGTEFKFKDLLYPNEQDLKARKHRYEMLQKGIMLGIIKVHDQTLKTAHPEFFITFKPKYLPKMTVELGSWQQAIDSIGKLKLSNRSNITVLDLVEEEVLKKINNLLNSPKDTGRLIALTENTLSAKQKITVNTQNVQSGRPKFKTYDQLVLEELQIDLMDDVEEKGESFAKEVGKLHAKYMKTLQSEGKKALEEIAYQIGQGDHSLYVLKGHSPTAAGKKATSRKKKTKKKADTAKKRTRKKSREKTGKNTDEKAEKTREMEAE